MENSDYVFEFTATYLLEITRIYLLKDKNVCIFFCAVQFFSYANKTSYVYVNQHSYKDIQNRNKVKYFSGRTERGTLFLTSSTPLG